MSGPDQEMTEPEPAPGHPEILRLIASNPGPMTLEGTNTYIYGEGPCWVIDPGPDDTAHIEAVRTAAESRGPVAGALITHSHFDHTAGVDRLGLPTIAPTDGDVHGGLRALATPGHAIDHVCLISEDGVCFSGDLILGWGSTYVPPDGGSLASYMSSLELVEAEHPSLICPGHGPWITEAAAKIAEYREHRLARERGLLVALEGGERSRSRLLDEVWSDVAEPLRPAAAVVMEAHLAKLEDEGRLPADLGE